MTDILERMIQSARDGWQRGLTAGSGGNISARCEEGIYITASGTAFRTLSRNDFLLVDETGQVRQGLPGLRPSIETGFHLAIYRCIPAVRAIYHCHPAYAAAFAAAGETIPLRTTTDRLLLKDILYVPEAEPGSQQLAELITVGLTENPDIRAVVLAKHGVIGMGDTPEHAYDMCEYLEEAARTELLLRLGFENNRRQYDRSN